MKTFQWAVVGAGPAGIAALGKLIDNGIDPSTIAWIDPSFAAGDLGSKWRNVSSNTKVSLFIKFLLASAAFEYKDCSTEYALHQLDPNKTCYLSHAAEPLLWVTQRLRTKVQSIESKVLKMHMTQPHWTLTLEGEVIQAKNVVLAIGAEPKTLPGCESVQSIPVEDALDASRLAKWVSSNDVVAVFGSSHSAIIAIRLLLEAGVKQVINFYRAPLRYAVDMGDWILFDNTGLKGETAVWAREYIEGVLAPNLVRVSSDAHHLNVYLPQCSKAVHTVGFKARPIPIEGLPELEYNKKSGIIAPGLFGCGIAFPEETVDNFGNVEASVGMWKFMRYLDRVVPVWIKYGSNELIEVLRVCETQN